MNKTYIAADLKLFDKTAAKKQKLTIQLYNQMIIDRINSIVDEDDFLILFGEITNSFLEDNKKYFSQIKAKWIVADLKDQPVLRAEFLWTDMGAYKAYSIDGFVAGTIKGEKTNVIISTSSSNIKLWLGEKNYIAMAESAAVVNDLLKEGEIYKDQILNLSMSVWDFYPINYEEIPRIIDDELLFREMEG